MHPIMKGYEGVLLAASAFMQNWIKFRMEATAYIGKEYDFGGNILNIVVPLSVDSKLLVLRIKLWERGCNRILKLIEANAAKWFIQTNVLRTAAERSTKTITSGRCRERNSNRRIYNTLTMNNLNKPNIWDG